MIRFIFLLPYLLTVTPVGIVCVVSISAHGVGLETDTVVA